MNAIKNFSSTELVQLLANLQLCHAQLRKWAAVLPPEAVRNINLESYSQLCPKPSELYPAYPFVCIYARHNMGPQQQMCEEFVREHFPKDMNKDSYCPFCINHHGTMRRIALCNRLIHSVRKQIQAYIFSFNGNVSGRPKAGTENAGA